jgi:hypothetical protein
MGSLGGSLAESKHHHSSNEPRWFETRGVAALLTMRDLQDLIPEEHREAMRLEG